MSEWFTKVESVCQEVAQREGCFLYDADFRGTGGNRTLRVFIDKEGGVGLEDCAQVSHSLNEILDQEDLIPGGPYHLEVSTPGVDRVLRKPWHFEKAVGQKIWVKTGIAFEELGVQEPTLKKAKQMEAVLKEVKDDQVVLENKKGKGPSSDVSLPLNQIEKAHVVFEMPKKLKP